MNHPTREEWMAYLYQEAPRSTMAELKRHLEACADCQKEIEQWQASMRGLQSWKLPEGSPGFGFVVPALKWGIAALFAVGLGYGLGRFSAPTHDVETLRAGIENSLRASLAQEIPAQIRQHTASEMKTTWASIQAQFLDRMEEVAANAVAASGEQTQGLLSAYDAALQNLDLRVTRQAADLATLRKDAETVAVLTEYGFRRNQQQLVRLATFNQPDGPPLGDPRPQTDR